MIEYPVKLNQDVTIVDAKGRVVVPMCWKNDLDHVRGQEVLGLLIVELLNHRVAIKDGELTVEQAIPSDSVALQAAPKMSVSERMKKMWAAKKAKAEAKKLAIA